MALESALQFGAGYDFGVLVGLGKSEWICWGLKSQHGLMSTNGEIFVDVATGLFEDLIAPQLVEAWTAAL